MDLLSNPNFKPCRRERCKVLGVHAEHTARKRKQEACPLCQGPLTATINRRGERQHCVDPDCGWGMTAKEQSEATKHA